MKAGRILLALTLAAVAVISATALRAQSQERSENGEQEAARQNFFTEPCDWLCRLRERQAQQLEGSWVHFPTPVLPPGTPPPPQRTTYLTFSRGGALIGSDRFEPFNSPQHGTWTHLGGNEFAWVAVADRFDTAGNFLGTFKARTKIILTGPDAFVGVSSVEFRDTAGNLVQARCATNRGERIRVEPLSEQCQNITPPR